jgi:PII-like signaling protein
MENNVKALLLRIFISSTDKYNQELVYESVVFKAKEAGLAGATVVKGILGYGASSIIHSYKFWEVSEKVPTVIEIIDEEHKVLSFYETILPLLNSMRHGCLAITQKVDVVLYKSGIVKS